LEAINVASLKTYTAHREKEPERWIANGWKGLYVDDGKADEIRRE
jgi:hypothetical protein